MPSARTLPHVAVLIVLFLWLPPSTPSAAAAELVLDPTWFSVARPYRYVEARRFEGGWNRGADVVVSDSLVRSPVTGTVRFAGLVAGRRVVTVATRMDGEPVVVTLTGLRAIEVGEGQDVRAGAVVGRGTALHVGAYDASRRSRYLPVRAGGMSAAAGVMPSRVGSPVPVRPSLSGSIAARLRAAILGEVGASDPRPGGTARASAPAGTTDVIRTGPWPHRDGGGGRTNVILLPSAGSRMRFEHERAAGAASMLARGVALARGLGARNATSVPPAGSHVAFGEDRAVGVSSARTRDAALRASGAASRGRSAASADGPAADGRAAGRSTFNEAVASRISGGPPGSAAGGRARSGFSPHPGLAGAPVAEVSMARPSEAVAASAAEQPLRPSPPEPSARSRSARGVAAAGAAIGLLSILFTRWRRRRRPEAREPRAMHQPLPVMLPHVRPYAYPVVRSDGSSVLPDIALAWSDRDPGTSPVTDRSPRTSTRAPEHA